MPPPWHRAEAYQCTGGCASYFAPLLGWNISIPLLRSDTETKPTKQNTKNNDTAGATEPADGRENIHSQSLTALLLLKQEIIHPLRVMRLCSAIRPKQ